MDKQLSKQEIDKQKRLREVRKNLKLNQDEFAQKIMVTQGHISDIERGRKTVSDQLLELVILRYGVNKEWFLTGKGSWRSDEYLDKYSQAAADLSDDPFIQSVLITYWNSSKEEREVMMDFALRLAEEAKARLKKPSPPEKK